MKRVIIYIVLLFIIGTYNELFAYSNSLYEINIPSTYSEIGENNFTDSQGNSVNLVISSFSYSDGELYTIKNLDSIVDKLYEEFDEYKMNFKEELKQQYGSYLSDEDIEEYLKSFTLKSIIDREVVSFTKNNYKCFHILSNYSFGDTDLYIDQYQVVSGNQLYTLTITTGQKEYLESSEVKNIVKSFTIKNFVEYQAESSIFDNAISSAISAVIVGGIGILVARIRNKKSSNDVEINNDEM